MAVQVEAWEDGARAIIRAGDHTYIYAHRSGVKTAEHVDLSAWMEPGVRLIRTFTWREEHPFPTLVKRLMRAQEIGDPLPL